MKKKYFQIVPITMLLLCMIVFTVQQASAQEIEQPSPSTGALQFQLLGGLGINYIGSLSDNSGYRIGADLSFGIDDKSGSRVSTSFNASGNQPMTSWYANTRDPEQTVKSYQVRMSGLLIQNLAEYEYTILYCGIGPSAEYLWGKNNSTSTETQTSYSSSFTTVYTNESESKFKTVGLGGVAIMGVKSSLLKHVALSAELELFALHEWTSQSNSYRSENISPPSSLSSYGDNSNTHEKGWNLSINAIRIGLIIEL